MIRFLVVAKIGCENVQLKIKSVKSTRIKVLFVFNFNTSFFISCAKLSVFSLRNEKKNSS